MTVVVTGATGHVGANLVRALSDAGRQVRALVRKDLRPLEGLEVEQREADVLDKASLLAAFEGADVVFHLAGLISILESDEKLLNQTNVGGTRNVVEACLECKVKRLVYTSSIEALMLRGGPDPITESVPVEAGKLLSAYSRSKYAASLEVEEGIKKGLDAVIVHPTAVCGPNDFKPSLLGQSFIEFAMRRLPGLVPGGFDFVDVRDLATGLIAAADKGRSGEHYLLAGSFVSMADMADALEESTGVPRPRMTVPFWLALPVAAFTPLYYKLSHSRPRFTSQSLKMLKDCRRVDCAKAREELDYHPRSGKDGIKAAVEWFREKEMIHPVFVSKKDPAIVIFAAMFLFICILGGIQQLTLGGWLSTLVGLGALLVGTGYALLNWPVRYEITSQALKVRGGLVRWNIPLGSITKVRPSRNPISAPAWSYARLRVDYQKNNKNYFVLISPAEREAFLQKLAQATPGIEGTGDHLTKKLEGTADG